MTKTAIVLFNLGGPDSLKAVQPFLYNLFSDRAIIDLPQPFRWLVASLISFKRTPTARRIYQHMGGKSPILEQSLAQAQALEQQLKSSGDYKVFVCMRHWHPMSDIVARNVKAYAPERIILLPLYPQYSTTTTGSSFAEWDEAARRAMLKAPTTRIESYPTDFSFIAAHVKLIRDDYWKAAEHGRPRILFSAHGLPEKIIERGDPYQRQVEQTVAAITQVLAIDGLDYRIAYQSRVGRLPWIGPSTDQEIINAGKDVVPLLVVPVSFVSEHSETLVELDIDYRNLAEKNNVPGYWRVPALGTDPFFIDALAGLCLNAGNESAVNTKDADICLLAA